MPRRKRLLVACALPLAALLSLCLVCLLARLISPFPLQTVVVQGFSMEPALEEADYLLVSRFAPIRRGDIIAFRYPLLDPLPGSSDVRFVKRVIALPGDTIHIVGNQVYVNDELIDEPYVLPENYKNPYSVEEQILGPGEYWVLGDNRDHSSDSHAWGPLPEDAIVGRVIWRYWPPTRRGTPP